jgi:hypothetical protein
LEGVKSTHREVASDPGPMTALPCEHLPLGEIPLVANPHPLQVDPGIGFLRTLEGFSFVGSWPLPDQPAMCPSRPPYLVWHHWRDWVYQREWIWAWNGIYRAESVDVLTNPSFRVPTSRRNEEHQAGIPNSDSLDVVGLRLAKRTISLRQSRLGLSPFVFHNSSSL